MRKLYSILISLIVLQQSTLAEITANTRFDPDRIPLGEQSTFIIEILETSSEKEPSTGQLNASSISRIEGLTTGRTTVGRLDGGTFETPEGEVKYYTKFDLRTETLPRRTGTINIPEHTLKYKGQTIKVPSTNLQVFDPETDTGETRDEPVFLEADLPDQLYIGQSISTELKLYIAEEMQLRRFNDFERNADGFTISDLPDESMKSTEFIGRQRYRVYTWPIKITPIQTGSQAIDFKFSLLVQSVKKVNSLGFFMEIPRSEPVNIFTEPATIDIIPLPEGKPDSFSGAIGKFALDVGSDTESAEQGEPIMLSVVVRGSGNFSRIEGPSYEETSNWKQFDPEKKFKASDTLGLHGNQRFDYIFIPQKAGKLEIPETKFSYFDPEAKKYVELIAPSIPVDIAAVKNTLVPPQQSTNLSSLDTELDFTRTLTTEEALLTLDYRPRIGQPVGMAILSNPAFMAANGAAALFLIATTFGLHRIKKNREDSNYLIRKNAARSLKLERESYEAAAADNDAAVFYKSAQAAIRHAATLKTNQNMQSANGAQIAELLNDNTTQVCTNFFAAADAHRFGGSASKDLDAAVQQVETILKSL